MTVIVTHAGGFHADESMAIALLERFFLLSPLRMTIDLPQEDVFDLLNGKVFHSSVFFPDGTEDARTGVPIVRTRDARLLEKATTTPDCFVIDVGGSYNEQMLNFDHHQKSMHDTWADGTPFSSTGLVWTWLLKNGHINVPKEVAMEVEEKIIKPLDLHDNGLAVSPMAAQLGGYNRTEDPKVQDEQFFKGLSFMRECLDNAVFAATLKLEAKKVLSKQWALAQKQGDTVVLLHKPLAYHDCTGLLKEISGGQASMIVIPGQGNRYSVISQPLEQAFSIKHPCPEEWRGQMNKQVSISGRQVMLRFAHKTGFMCVVEGSLKDAHAVAKWVVRHSNALSTAQQSVAKSDTSVSRPPRHGRPSRQDLSQISAQVAVSHKRARKPS